MKNVTAEKIKEIINLLSKEYPDVKCHLDFRNPFELLISTVLAAQATDIQVNKVMVPLYKSVYKSCKDILEDGIDNFRNNIKSINFFNNKSKSVLGLCESIEKKHGGNIPSSMDELTGLPGVGRKSASVVLGNCFGRRDVIIVDTHLKRVSARLGIIENDNPEKIETELKNLIPPSEQYHFSMRIGEHGRQICHAKKPECRNCLLNHLCPSSDNKM